MSAFADLRMYTRFAASVRPFLSRTIGTAEARADIEQALASRAERFLHLAERGVYARPRSPYRRLLAAAGCDFEDLCALVRAEGLEEALGKLDAAGVYVTFEEFKGYQPVRRGSTTFHPAPGDFDNPLTRRAYQTRTSGSTGAGTRVWLDLDHLAAQASHARVALAAHELIDAPLASWRGILPGAAGINFCLRSARAGLRLERWFTPVRGDDFGARRYRFATSFLLALLRRAGAEVPTPEFVPIAEPGPIVAWARAAVAERGKAVLNTTVSGAVRVAWRARTHGIDLQGVTFWVGGEPLTDAKVRAIRDAGAGVLPTYNFVETGFVASACARPLDPTDVHLHRDLVAVLTRPRSVPGAATPVPALRFTSLRLTAPKILLNTESDDFAIVERRDCGCPLGAMGYDLHLRQIFSFRKLTGEGVTLVGSEMVRILEEVLPARFGGSPINYQLLEEEQGDGTTRLFIVVDPTVPGIVAPAEVVGCVLDELRGRPGGAEISAAVWRQAGTLAVRRAAPALTAGGKLMPLHSSRAATATATAPQS